MPNLLFIVVLTIWCFMLNSEVKDLKTHDNILAHVIQNQQYEIDILTQRPK